MKSPSFPFPPPENPVFPSQEGSKADPYSFHSESGKKRQLRARKDPEALMITTPEPAPEQVWVRNQAVRYQTNANHLCDTL